MQVTICDVGPRDGLQNEPDTLAPAVRAELVSRLAGAGVPRIEAVSFVRDDRVPQMAGAEEVVAAAARGRAELSGLVLNERGYERFARTSLDRVNCTLAATEEFNRRNGNASLDDAVARVHAILTAATVPTTVTVSCAWGCPFEGEVDPGRVADVCERLEAAGELVLADTIGVATPRRVRRLVERVSILGRPVGAHLHNTRNTGYASAWAALDGGATLLDASIGGLGGCPFSPQATGNVATEDLVWQLERDGVGAGIDVGALVTISRWLEQLLGRRLEGSLYRAASWPA
jgi:isopropylmalate/homocitrate/citramalate synthase